MRQPLLLAVDEDREALESLETQLVQRYAPDYRVECLADPDEAVRTLKGLARGGEEVALVLAATAFSRGSGGHLLEQVHQLHSHDEAVSSSLLEWARDLRLVPQTVHIFAETWSGRAYQLREVFERCVVPHAFFLADSDAGRELLARAGTDARLPLMPLPDGRVLSDPSNTQIAEAAGPRRGSRIAPWRIPPDERERDRGGNGARARPAGFRGAARPPASVRVRMKRRLASLLTACLRTRLGQLARSLPAGPAGPTRIRRCGEPSPSRRRR